MTEAETTLAPAEPKAPPTVPWWYERLTRRGRVGLWALLFAWLGLGVWWFGDWGPLGGRAPGRRPPPQPRLILLVAQGDGQPPALALAHADPAGRGDLLLVPAATIVESPGVGPRSVAEVLEELGSDGLAVALANALGTRIPSVVVVPAGALRSTVDAVGGVPVDVPETVRVVEGGLQRTLFAKGRQRMDGRAFVNFLTAAVPGQDEMERVARQSAAWRGLFSKRAVAAFENWSGVDEAFTTTYRALARDKAFPIATAPVRKTSLAQVDRYEIARDQLDTIRPLLDDVMGPASRAGRRVRLLVGADGPVALPVARLLVDRGYAIVLTGRASRPYDVTRAVMAEDTPRLRRNVKEILTVLGMGKIGLSQAPQTLVDVTLVIGRDWAAAHGHPQS